MEAHLATSVWWGPAASIRRLRWGGERHDSHDPLLPWGISLEPFPPPSSTPAAPGSTSSPSEAASCCRPPQLALFSPMWPSMVWDRHVSEKRAHSMNSGSATYVMKPGGTWEAADGDFFFSYKTITDIWISQKYWPIWIFPTVLDSLSQRGLTSSLCFFSISPEIRKRYKMHQMLDWISFYWGCSSHNRKEQQQILDRWASRRNQNLGFSSYRSDDTMSANQTREN